MPQKQDLKLKVEKIRNDLTKLISGDVFTDIFTRIAYSTDASIYQIVPQCVVCPRVTDDVVALIKYAAENNIPVTARGAGSGLAGESLCEGFVIDFRRYMNNIIGMEENGTKVVCQPGVVLADLNNYLVKFGKKIGPDPSSGDRAVISGIVANNATGAHSLQYGYISEHVSKIQTVLDDGSLVDFENDCDPNQLQGRGSRVAQACIDLLEKNETVINAAMPGTKRNRSGYNIANICNDGRIDIPKLLAGSEGTLGLFTEITLKTIELPKFRALLQLEFATFDDMARAVPILVDCRAAACELMDRKVMDVALESLTLYQDIFPKDCQAVLLVEQTGQTKDQVRAKIDKCISSTYELSCGKSTFFDAAEQLRIWKSRKDAVPLLGRKRCISRPVPFIEDVSVDNSRLSEYVSGMQDIGKKYDIPMAFYGHAGDGELHIRPYLDLARQTDVEKMKAIADDVFKLAWSLGGTISGEHADGLVRASFIKRQYGEEFYEILKTVKKIFDPAGILNPGKIINDDPDVMTRNLLAGNSAGLSAATALKFQKDEFGIELGLCSGCGLCTSTQKGSSMCPVYRASNDELGCCRAKVNLIRAWLAGSIDECGFESDEFKHILSLCINCKTCQSECPSGVDISTLIIEARARLAQKKGHTITETVLARNRRLSMAGGLLAPVSSFFISLPTFKWFLEKAVGLDRQRAIPGFSGRSFIRKARKRLKAQPVITDPVDKVAYFVDTYAAYNDHDLGFAVINTLYHNNIDVMIPDQLPVPLPAIVYGDLKTARRDLDYIIKNLAQAVRDGYRVVCSEPSAALCLTKELHLLVDTEDARLVSENTCELMTYLAGLNDAGKLKKPARVLKNVYVYHKPCHLTALGSTGEGVELVRDFTGAVISDLNAGCCGLSGTYGMQKKNYNLSVEIGSQMADAVKAASARQAMTECAACKMQIEHLANKKAVHPIKVLAQAYGLTGEKT